MQIKIQDIYQYIDSFAPFALQEKWDNSGLLVGSLQQKVSGVLVALDISPYAVREACEKHCSLIVSHHPVIFSALKAIHPSSVSYQLIQHQIAALCCHTNLDMAAGGLNDWLAERLCTVMNTASNSIPLLPDGFGRILTLQHSQDIRTVAMQAKQALGCEMVRYSAEYPGSIRKIGICSGSGASMLEEIADICDCDCFITGDVKHDRWYKAQELGIALIDCGHYDTEQLMVTAMTEALQQQFPDLPVIACTERNPVCYV